MKGKTIRVKEMPSFCLHPCAADIRIRPAIGPSGAIGAHQWELFSLVTLEGKTDLEPAPYKTSLAFMHDILSWHLCVLLVISLDRGSLFTRLFCPSNTNNLSLYVFLSWHVFLKISKTDQLAFDIHPFLTPVSSLVSWFGISWTSASCRPWKSTNSFGT